MTDRLVRLLISLVVAAGDTLTRLVRGRRTSGSCVVINYHSISKESRLRFGRQLDLLPRLAHPIPAAQVMSLEDGRRYVAITADDAFCSLIEHGIPELNQRQIPVTLFVPTGYLGRPSSWDDQGGENKVGEEVVSADDLKRLAECILVNFGSHCVTHPDLTRLAKEEVWFELQQSKELLETIVGRKINALSFPYGSHGLRELELAENAGYRFCFDSTPQTVFSVMPEGLTGRVSVQPTDWDIEFSLKVIGAYRWVRWASSWKRRMRSLRIPKST